MSTFDIIAPKLGESILEVTITKWFVKENDIIKEDDMLFEVASDKVDSEIPSPVAGKIIKINYKEEDTVSVGKVVAVIDMNYNENSSNSEISQNEQTEISSSERAQEMTEQAIEEKKSFPENSSSSRFYSPLVKSIAKKENITAKELDNIKGSGKNGRVRKQDVLTFLENRDEKKEPKPSKEVDKTMETIVGREDKVIEMDRVRRIIADHMVMSKKISPHVTSVVEADVSNLVKWRNKHKDAFYKREKTKLTFTHMFVEAAAKSLCDFPLVNSSVDGYKIIMKKDINIGMAVALHTGNLIVPVLKKADQKNLRGLAISINQLVEKARENKLQADDLQDGTFTITNFGTFRNIIGTPIINQPQVAILATGSIEKKPAVVETSEGDVILPRHKMYLSLTYDHRIVDGMLGGQFLRRIADYLEDFDINRTI